MRKHLSYLLQACAAYVFYALFRLIPVSVSSFIFGKIMRFLGPLARKPNSIAEGNIANAFPEKTPAEQKRIRLGMWENIGRVVGEFPHVNHIVRKPGKHVEIVNLKYVEAAYKDGKPGIFFSAHTGNWEVASLPGRLFNMDLHRIYRPPNNFYVDALIRFARREIKGELLSKKTFNLKILLSRMKAGEHLAILVDQKLDEGLAVPFFNAPAKTTTVPARLALKFNCPLIPAFCERVDGTRFRIVFYPPLPLPDTGNMDEDVYALMKLMNQTVEAWIREHPEQWLWAHKRWMGNHHILPSKIT